MNNRRKEQKLIRARVHGREWEGFLAFCSRAGQDPYDVIKSAIETDFTSGGKKQLSIEVTDEDATNSHPHYWKLLRKLNILLLISSLSILLANVFLGYILNTQSVITSFGITLQAIALFIVMVSAGVVDVTSRNYLGSNRRMSIEIVRWVELGAFYSLSLLMVAILIVGVWHAATLL